MIAGVICDKVACGVGVVVAGPLSSSASVRGDLSSVVAIVVVVGGISSSGMRCSSEYHHVLLSLNQAGIQSILDLDQYV